MKIHWILTHGTKGKGINPGLTSEGREAVSGKLPEAVLRQILNIVCGTGRRHRETMESVGLGDRPYSTSPMAGTGDSMEIIDNEKIIIMEDGSHIPIGEYKNGIKPSAAKSWLYSGLPDHTLIIGGRELLVALGKADAESGALYRLEELSMDPLNEEWIVIKE